MNLPRSFRPWRSGARVADGEPHLVRADARVQFAYLGAEDEDL